MVEHDPETPATKIGTTIGGHVSHTGGCWLMIIGLVLAVAVGLLKFCSR